MLRRHRCVMKVMLAPESGLSLVEVLLATVILSVGLLGTAALLAGTLRANNASKNISVSTMLAQDRIESLRTLGYSEIGESDTTTTEDYGSIGGFPHHRRVTSILVDSPTSGMKTTMVEVFWSPEHQPIVLNAFLTR